MKVWFLGRQLYGHATALVVGSGAAASVFSLVTGEVRFFPIAFVFILVAAAVLGLPIYAAVRHANRVNWKSAAIAGFAIGAIIPAIIVFTGPAADQASSNGVPSVVDGAYTSAGWIEALFFVSGFGFLGVLGGLLFWFGLASFADRRNRQDLDDRDATTRAEWRAVALSAAALAFIGAAVAIPQVTKDRSCHNTLRDGRTSVSPVASFELKVGPEQWMQVER